MRAYEALWNTLMDHLDRDGLLPIQAARLTPSEIAKHVHQKTGDERVVSFVWGYLYPKKYGGKPGTLSEKKAKQLVASFEKAKISFLATVPSKNSSVTKPHAKQLCQVCLKRWPITEEVIP